LKNRVVAENACELEFSGVEPHGTKQQQAQAGKAKHLPGQVVDFAFHIFKFDNDFASILTVP